jgi:precorrin-2 dehydrogenase/sirohydrochlorin ferrochelatase/precorrin-6A/cobalt-precorrin-6A reductase
MRFPLFIDIENKKVLVVGAGNIGCRRIETWLKFGAKVTVISSSFAKSDLIDKVEYINRKFESTDIGDYALVTAATPDREVNRLVGEICRQRNIPVSIADSADESTFFFPAVCVNDELSIGVVSSGEKHSLVRKTAKRIREEIL